MYYAFANLNFTGPPLRWPSPAMPNPCSDEEWSIQLGSRNRTSTGLTWFSSLSNKNGLNNIRCSSQKLRSSNKHDTRDIHVVDGIWLGHFLFAGLNTRGQLVHNWQIDLENKFLVSHAAQETYDSAAKQQDAFRLTCKMIWFEARDNQSMGWEKIRSTLNLLGYHAHNTYQIVLQFICSYHISFMSFKNLHAWHFIATSVKQQCHQYLLIIRTLDWCNNRSLMRTFVVKPLYHQLCSKHIQRILRTLSIVGKDNSQFVGDLPWFTYIILQYIIIYIL